MLLIREFESTAGPLATSGAIPGGMHAATGQEAVAVGVTSVLGPQDVAAASHRSHHVALAKGMDPALGHGRAVRQGRPGARAAAAATCTWPTSPSASTGPTGSSARASASRWEPRSRRATARTATCAAGFFGDGGANTGRVWEFVNLAAAWKLPLIVVCENNGYAVETPINAAMAGESVASRAAGFGLPSVQVDGQDVVAPCTAWRPRRPTRARSGGGPTFIEALTYRHLGHDIGERGQYRTTEEVAWWETQPRPDQPAAGRPGQGGRPGRRGLSEQAAGRARARVKDAVEYAEAVAPARPGHRRRRRNRHRAAAEDGS